MKSKSSSLDLIGFLILTSEPSITEMGKPLDGGVLETGNLCSVSLCASQPVGESPYLLPNKYVFFPQYFSS